MISTWLRRGVAHRRRLALPSAACLASIPQAFVAASAPRAVEISHRLMRALLPWVTWNDTAANATKQERRFSVSPGDASAEQGGFRVWANGGGLVHQDAIVDHSVIVHPFAVVHSQAAVSPGAVIGSGSVLGPGVSLGEGSVLGPNVSLQNCRVGKRAILHPGVSIGQDGFGFLVDSTGAVVKKPQELGVAIMDDVELGANTCVDRGSWRDTVIGDSTKIDNLVQVGHNVIIGSRCIICAHCAIGGSAELGDYVVMGGKAAVKDHVRIVSKARIAAKAGVAQDISRPGDYAGFPAVPAGDWRRQVAIRRRASKSAGAGR